MTTPSRQTRQRQRSQQGERLNGSQDSPATVSPPPPSIVAAPDEEHSAMSNGEGSSSAGAGLLNQDEDSPSALGNNGNNQLQVETTTQQRSSTTTGRLEVASQNSAGRALSDTSGPSARATIPVSLPLVRETYVSSSASCTPRTYEPQYTAFNSLGAQDTRRRDNTYNGRDSAMSRNGVRADDNRFGDGDEGSSGGSRQCPSITSNVGASAVTRQTATNVRAVPTSTPRRVATASDVGLKPDVYDGTGNFETFRTRFQVVADANRWTEEERLFILPACLRGHALEAYSRWLNTGPLPATSKGFLEALRDTFTDRRMERSASRRMFQAIRQDSGEGMERFFIRFTSLADAAGISDEEDLKEQWLAAIDPRVVGAIAGQEFGRLVDMAQRSVTAYNNLAFSRSSRDQAVVGNIETVTHLQSANTGVAMQQRISSIESRVGGIENALQRIEEGQRRYGFGRRDYGYYRSPSPKRYGDQPYRYQDNDRSRSPRRDNSARDGAYHQGYEGQSRQRRPSSDSMGNVLVCSRCGGRDHLSTYCRHSDRVCFRCKRQGHEARECPTLSETQDGPVKPSSVEPLSGN